MYIFFFIFQCVIFLKRSPPPKKKLSTKISQLIGTGLCVPKGSILGSANEDHAVPLQDSLLLIKLCLF